MLTFLVTLLNDVIFILAMAPAVEGKKQLYSYFFSYKKKDKFDGLILYDQRFGSLCPGFSIG